jgi:hypothetical protein
MIIICLLIGCIHRNSGIEVTVDLVEENIITVENPKDNAIISILVDHDHSIYEGDKVIVHANKRGTTIKEQE